MDFLESIQQVATKLQAGRLPEAFATIASWEKMDFSGANPICFDWLWSIGLQLAKAEYREPAVTVLTKAVDINPGHGQAQYNLGLLLALIGQHARAIEHYDRALKINSDDTHALINKAASLNDLGRYAEALAISDLLLQGQSDLNAAWMIQAIAYARQEQWELALAAYDKVLEIDSRNVEAHMRRAFALTQLKRTQEAIFAYERAVLFDPQSVEALSNLGALFHQERQFTKALASCQAALKIDAHFANAWINQGFTLADMGLHNQAIESYAKAIAIDPTLSSAWVGKGFSHSALKQFEGAAKAFEKALALNPGIEFLLGPLVHAKMQICDWTNYDPLFNQLVDSLDKGLKVSPPFQIIGLMENPKLIQSAARTWVADQHPTIFSYPRVSQRSNSPTRIKLGYFSADFREHPVSQLIAGMIEAHDRNHFEVYAFSLGPKTTDVMRDRLEKGFDHFIDLHDLSDQEAVALARKEGIDIAIDLTGLTGNSRPGIFAQRAAPIQVNYLGFPSTMGAPFMDYLIADEMLIPLAEQDSYDEQILYMPHSFQANDASKTISANSLKRSDFGLPEEGLVFCAFSNSFKITPPVFAGWMRILKAIPKSVLWLSIENETARQNLKRQANAQGISGERIIFAQRLPSLADHLARYRLADLFLDTTPYGAHTTASDALWAGLPVLTRLGRGYASRVAASLLHALDLDDLICSTQEAYEKQAITLAQNPMQLKSHKVKLHEQLKTSPLFNTQQFTHDLEKIYLNVYQKHHGAMVED